MYLMVLILPFDFLLTMYCNMEQSVVMKMQSILHDLFWLEAWQQKLKRDFHPLKCKIVCLTTKRDPPKREYIFCGEILEEVESHPYLGVVFDNEWGGPPHI